MSEIGSEEVPSAVVSVEKPVVIDRDFDIPAIEHVLFGSGIRVDGTTINSDFIKNELDKAGGIPASLLKPSAILRGDDIAEINKRRVLQKEFKGIWGPFNIDLVDQSVFDKELTPTIELDQIQENGEVPLKWKFAVKNSQGVGIDYSLDAIRKLFPFSKDFGGLFNFEEEKKVNTDGVDENLIFLTIQPKKIIY